MESFFHQIRFPVMTLEEFAQVEKTGILTAMELELIKIVIKDDKKDISGFDFNQRYRSSRLHELLLKEKLRNMSVDPLCQGFFYNQRGQTLIPVLHVLLYALENLT